ncbi:MAG: RsmB/NOP family class I SAM-dependent RNA methyltransferase [Candidatus Hermodarchaeota archaeon]
MNNTINESQFLSSVLEKRYRALFKEEYTLFLKALTQPFPITVRVNVLKSNINEIEEIWNERGWKWTPVSFCRVGFILEIADESINWRSVPEFVEGKVFPQGIPSMIPPLALEVEMKPNLHVLDMCAAPGGKTTFIAELMENSGVILANDISERRTSILRSNCYRMGVLNTVFTQMNATLLPSTLQFDRILLDAPCTSSGLMRNYETHKKKWSYNRLRSLQKRQKRLLNRAIELLKPGGILVYSTCSIEPEENEFMIQFALEEHSNIELEEIPMSKNFKTRRGLVGWKDRMFSGELKKSMRIYPQDEGTEGFFIARIRKND